MLYLKLSEPMPVDKAFPLAVRVAGLQAGDAVEVAFGEPTQTWHPRGGPTPWIRATATAGEFMVAPALLPGPITFVATMAGHRAVGAVVVQMGGTQQSWSHPGATAREGEAWSFLRIADDRDRISITALDTPAGTHGPGNEVSGAEQMAAVVDLSASMEPAVRDGRLEHALAAVQAAAARSKLSAVTVTFVSGQVVKKVVLPVSATVKETVAQVVGETGWRTGTGTDLITALGAARSGGDVVWIISDVPPVAPVTTVPTGRRIGFVATGPQPPPGVLPPGLPDTVHLNPGESVTQLSERMVAHLV